MTTVAETQANNTNQNSNSGSAVDIKTFNETYRVYVKVGEDGKIDETKTKLTTAGKDNSAWTKLDATDSGYTLMLEQTAKEYEAGTWAGAALLIEDEEERVNIFNRGLSQKTGQKLRSGGTDTPGFATISDDGLSLVFDPQEQPYDTMDWINEGTRRRNLSPADKALKTIRGLVRMMNPGLEGDALEVAVNKMFANLQQ